jgi:hypothetical protein
MRARGAENSGSQRGSPRRPPGDTLYYAMEAAELDEPGATTALIELKLSDNAQFRDPAGACKLMETAVARGDQSMAPRLAGCRGS